jgi:hypothetical protein
MAYASAFTRALFVAGCVGCLALGACARQEQDQMSWARAALERNDRVEIVAADPQARTFTVRSKDTGQLTIVRADQLIGSLTTAPLASSAASAATAPTAAAAAPAGTETEESSAKSAPAAPAAEEANERGKEAAAPSPPAQPPVFASRALHPGSPARPVPGQILEAGPGYTIEAGSGPAAAPAAREPGATGAAVELRHEPIVCQGERLLHIDNLNLQFEGDAVSAEDGCEIHITNSRIRATGVGVSARAANVHIDNSLIEGDAASIDASDGAQIYTASSRFRGLSRQLDTAAVHDLGGNVWN